MAVAVAGAGTALASWAEPVALVVGEVGCGGGTTGKVPDALPFAGGNEVKLGRGAIADGIGVADAVATPTGGMALRGGSVTVPLDDGPVASGVVTPASSRTGTVEAGVAAGAVASRPGTDA